MTDPFLLLQTTLFVFLAAPARTQVIASDDRGGRDRRGGFVDFWRGGGSFRSEPSGQRVARRGALNREHLPPTHHLSGFGNWALTGLLLELIYLMGGLDLML